MLLPIYSALLLGSKDNGDIHFSHESCISYIHFFFLHYAFQKAIS